MDIETMIEEIRDAVIQLGTDAVSEVIGYDVAESDNLDALMDEVFDQMPEEDIVNLYCRFCS